MVYGPARAVNIYAMKKPRRINSVSVGLTLIGLFLAYAVWAFVPVMWPLWQMAGILRTGCAKAYSIADDEQVMKFVLKDSRRTKLQVTEDNLRFVRVPYPEEELLDFDATRRDLLARTGRECRFHFRYVDEYELPLLGWRYELPYETTVTLDLRRDEGDTNALYELFYNSCTCTSVRGGG
jgi:hypothetical protein